MEVQHIPADILLDDPERRAVFYDNVLNFYQGVRDVNPPGGTDGILIGMAIGSFSLRGRPTNISKLAEITGYSRRSIRRYIDLFIEEGLIEEIPIENNLTFFRTLPRSEEIARAILAHYERGFKPGGLSIAYSMIPRRPLYRFAAAVLLLLFLAAAFVGIDDILHIDSVDRLLHLES